MNNFKVMMNGIIKENPIFVLLLGMCPTLGTTSSAINGMGMGLATMFVLICSNVVISSIKNLIPDMVRIPSFIVVIASFVTLLQMIMQAYVPDLYATLGLFIPLIVVNCIVLGRAEAFAAKNNPLASMFDGIGMGLGLTIALSLLGAVREFLGTGKITDNHFYSGYCRTGADGRNYSEESFSFFVSGTGGVPAVDYNELLYSRCGNPGNPERL